MRRSAGDAHAKEGEAVWHQGRAGHRFGMDLVVVSGNAGKRRTFERVCGQDVEAVDLSIVELQSESFAEIARHKAEEAWERLRRPVVVEDGGISVPALNGWPGTYTKPFLSAVGLDGLLKLLPQLPCQAEFTSAVAYADADGLRVWEGCSRRGELVAPGGGDLPEAWSALWQVFVPEGETRRLAELSAEERAAIVVPDAPIEEFGRWWRSQQVQRPRR